MNKKDQDSVLVRPEKRYFLGVCEAIGRKQKIDPIMLRIAFIITTFFFVITPLIYFILGLNIPNYKTISDKETRNTYQITGLILGGVLGAVIGFYTPIMISGMISGIVLVFFGIVGLPIGALIGFMIGRAYAEKKLN